jgi:hypothetical protein
MVSRTDVVINILITIVFLTVTSLLSYKLGIEERDIESFDYKLTKIFLGIFGGLSGIAVLLLIIRTFLVNSCKVAPIQQV